MQVNPGFRTDIDFGSLFEPDALIAAQFYDTTRRTYHAKPELRLMAAILEDAVAALTTDQRRCTDRQCREFADALEWIGQSEESDWLFSFGNICYCLGIDPARIRQGLLRKIAENGDRESRSRSKGRLGHRSPRRKVIRLRAGVRSVKMPALNHDARNKI